MKTFDQVKLERKEAARLQVINVLVNGEETVLKQITSLEEQLQKAKDKHVAILSVKDKEELTLEEANKLVYYSGSDQTIIINGAKIAANSISADRIDNTTLKVLGGVKYFT